MKRSYIVLACATIVAITVWIVEKPYEPNGGDLSLIKIFPAFDPKVASAVEIEYLLDGVRLAKDSTGKWQVSLLQTELKNELAQKEGKEVTKSLEYKADNEKIEKSLEELSLLRAESLVSTNPEKQSTYQVNKTGKHMKVLDVKGGTLADIYFGKEGTEVATSFVRRGDQNEVYLVADQLGVRIPTDIISWRDKKIWKLDRGKIRKIEIQKGEEKYTVSKEEDGNWYQMEPEKTLLETEKAEEFANRFSMLTATRFAHEADSDTGLDKPSLILVVETADGTKYRLKVGGKDKQGYLYARRDGDGESDIYLVDAQIATFIPPIPK